MQIHMLEKIRSKQCTMRYYRGRVWTCHSPIAGTWIWNGRPPSGPQRNKGFNYKPDYFVGVEPKALQSQYLDDPEISTCFRPHKDGAVYPHTVAEFKSSFGKHNHAIGQIRYGGAACAKATMLLRTKILGDQDCFDIPLSTSYTITPEGFRCFVHFCRMLNNEIHYYPAKVLNLTMGASWTEFRQNLRQFWKFLKFGQSIRESDLRRLHVHATIHPLTPSPSNDVDSDSTVQDHEEDSTDSQRTPKTALDMSASGHKRGLSSPNVEDELYRRRYGSW